MPEHEISGFEINACRAHKRIETPFGINKSDTFPLANYHWVGAKLSLFTVFHVFEIKSAAQ